MNSDTRMWDLRTGDVFRFVADENDHLTADKVGPLHTIHRRIDLWITRENNFEKQPSK
jgi:hypothetical protein